MESPISMSQQLTKKNLFVWSPVCISSFKCKHCKKLLFFEIEIQNDFKFPLLINKLKPIMSFNNPSIKFNFFCWEIKDILYLEDPPVFSNKQQAKSIKSKFFKIWHSLKIKFEEQMWEILPRYSFWSKKFGCCEQQKIKRVLDYLFI